MPGAGSIDSISIEIGASSTKAINQINRLKTVLGELKTAMSGETGDTARKLNEIAGALKNLSGLGNISIGNKLPDQLRNVASAVSEVSSDTVKRLSEMTAAIDKLRGIDLRGFSNAVKAAKKETIAVETGKESTGISESLGKVKVDAPAATQEIEQMSRAAGISFSTILSGASKALPVIASIANAAKRAATALWGLGKKVAIKIESATLGKLKQRLDTVQKGLHAIGRIALYRLIRSAIKAVTQAFQEGLKNAYLFSKGLADAVDGRIATAMDSLSAKTLTMKNQLGAAFGSLLTAIAPIINAIIGLITGLANAITMLFAAFTGGTFLKAKDTTAEFADNMKAGGGAAKEWKNQLMGFDEINKLTDQAGGGGGGGGNALNPDDMYEVMQIPEAIRNYVDQLKAAIKNSKWKEAGDLLAEKFNSLVARVPWAELGRKLGHGLTGIIETMYYALKASNFKTLGWSIAQFVNKAIKEIDFNTWGRLLVLKFTKALDLLMGFLGSVNWKDVGTAIGDFLRGALDEASEWIQSYDWEQVARNIKNNLNEFIDGLDPQETKESLRTFLRTAFDAAFAFVDELFPDGLIPTIASAIGNFFTKIVTALNEEDLQVAHNILQYKIDHALFGDLADWWWSKGNYAGKDIIMGFINGTTSRTADLETAINNAVKDPTENAFTETKTAIDNITGETYQIIDSKYGDYTSAVSLHSTEIKGYNADLQASFDGVGTSVWTMADSGADAMGQLNGSVAAGAEATGSWLDWLASKFSSLASLGSLFGGFGFGGGGGSFAGTGWIPGHAQGGFPEDGLFFANHGELVGKFANGKTAVANNEQITEGISNAVYGAFMTAFSQTGGSNGNDKEVRIYLDGREIARTTTKYQNQMARAGAY